MDSNTIYGLFEASGYQTGEGFEVSIYVPGTNSGQGEGIANVTAGIDSDGGVFMQVFTNPHHEGTGNWSTVEQSTVTAAFQDSNFEFSFPVSAVQFDGVAQNSHGLSTEYSFDVFTGITLNQNEDGFDYGDGDSSDAVEIVE